MKSYVAELIATFALTFIGAGSIIADASTHGGIVAIALAHGLTLMSMIYAVGHLSGAHVNPAVTIGLCLGGQFPSKKVPPYIVAQLLGALLAGGLLKFIFPLAPNDLGSTLLGPNISFAKGIAIEAILTFLLVFTIFGVAVDKRGSQLMCGIAIGLVLTFDIIMGGVFTGASMNPARSFGPAFFSGAWQNHLVYWIGPVLGSSAAALVYSKIMLTKD